MNYNKIPEKTKVLPISLPLFYKGGSTAVLIIHGFMGSPHNMIYLSERLNKGGFTVFVPRLPGHGTNSDDFVQSSWQDWLRTSIDAYLNLAAKYNKVYVAGLSMGALLTVILSAKYKPEKIVLAAPAIEVSNWKVKLAPFIRYFIKKIDNKEKRKYDDSNLMMLANEYWNYYWISKLADFRHLQKMAKRYLKDVISETLVIVSKSDRSVPLKAGDIIDKNIKAVSKKRVVLKDSSHIIVNDVEKERVADEIIKWFLLKEN